MIFILSPSGENQKVPEQAEAYRRHNKRYSERFPGCNYRNDHLDDYPIEHKREENSDDLFYS